MAKFDWKSAVGAIAPTIATALGGPLAGLAVKTLGTALLGKPEAKEQEIASLVMGGLGAEHIVALRKADNDFSVRMKELDIDLEKLKVDVEKAYVQDVQSARTSHAGNPEVTRLGFVVLLIFSLITGAALFGCYQLLTGGIKIADVGIVAAVFGLIGTIIGYVSAKADQVTSYFFGSSAGSKQKTDAMASAFTQIGRKQQ